MILETLSLMVKRSMPQSPGVRVESVVSFDVCSKPPPACPFVKLLIPSIQAMYTSKNLELLQVVPGCQQYLTIIRRRRGDYRGIFTETKSR